MTYNVFSGTLNPTHFTSPDGRHDGCQKTTPAVLAVVMARVSGALLAGYLQYLRFVGRPLKPPT